MASKIAWRNIWRHKGKSLVLGLLVFIGALLMTVGNGLISGMEKGLSENIVQLFTGDLVVLSSEQESNDVFFDSEGKPLKVIKDYPAVKRVLEKEQQIEDFLPVAAGMVFVFNSGSEMGDTMLLGVDISHYRSFFPDSIKITEGRLFLPGERGVLISEEARKRDFNMMDFWLLPDGVPLNRAKLPADVRELARNLEIRRDLVFMGASDENTSVDIRVPVKGVYRYKSLNKIWDGYGIIDIESFREAHNYITGCDGQVKIPQSETELLKSEQLDQLFTSKSIVDDTALASEPLSFTEILAGTENAKTKYNVDSGAYNLIFLKVKSGQAPQRVQGKLNEVLKAKKLPARVIGWKEALGIVGSIAVTIKVALNLFIMFVFFVVAIVIMNTLNMAALERSSEIAMMRAIGARKGFLREMFIDETVIIAFCGGCLGIIVGIGVIYALSFANISTSNEILQLVYGGDKLNPLITLADLTLGLLELGLVTCMAVLYPLRVVGKIVPLDAIARE